MLEEPIRNFKKNYEKGDLEKLKEAGIEPSFSNVIGCRRCPFLHDRCIIMSSEIIEDVERLEKEYGVIIIGRCPLLLVDP